MKYIFSIIILTLSISAFAQQVEWQPLTREIAIDYSDSILKARIMINPTDIKIVDEYVYYWHNKGQINRNMGGYSGDILHGDYIVFNKEKQMITQGQFDKGLKSGTWKRWYANGNLWTIENWKNGFLNGTLKTFEEDGDIRKVIEYNKGQVVDKEDKSFRISFPERLKSSADSTLKDTIPEPY